VGYVFERPASKDGGATRYTAVFRDVRGRLRLADRAWRQAEAEVAAGKVTDPQRGRQTLRHFVENGWFANHVIEATTRQNYRYMLDRYLLPELGAMRMVEILPNHIREWITRLQHVHGANPPTVRRCKTVLDAILTTAVQDQVIMLHAGRGVKTPPVAAKPRRIINAEQFRRIHAALPHGTMRLLVETDVESGLRWGELTELRVKDLDLPTGVLTVSRAVVRLTSRRIEGGPRFLVKAYPKDKEWRRLR
jgi:integrase